MNPQNHESRAHVSNLCRLQKLWLALCVCISGCTPIGIQDHGIVQGSTVGVRLDPSDDALRPAFAFQVLEAGAGNPSRVSAEGEPIISGLVFYRMDPDTQRWVHHGAWFYPTGVPCRSWRYGDAAPKGVYSDAEIRSLCPSFTAGTRYALVGTASDPDWRPALEFEIIQDGNQTGRPNIKDLGGTGVLKMDITPLK